ncbi:MAG: hypothetical protein ACJ8C4_06865, partial [Gemmataceae bacterium]
MLLSRLFVEVDEARRLVLKGGFAGRAVELAARSSLAVVVVVVFVCDDRNWAWAPQKWSTRLTKVRRSPARIPQNSPQAFLLASLQLRPTGNAKSKYSTFWGRMQMKV